MNFKKILMLISIVSTLSFLGCGGSSEEAKELLQKILTVVGFPPNVVQNICQDDNHNDLCDSLELTAINGEGDKWESTNSISTKVTETSEGQYLLETATPCVPILLELQDSDVTYDEGEFTLKFSGVEYGQTEKELSILEAMIDAGHLSSSSVTSIRNLNYEESQNSFYSILYRNLKTNLNTLRATGLTKTQAMIGTLKEMADELISFGVTSTLPTSLNNCNGETACVESILQELSNKLIIDANEATLIYNAQKDNFGEMVVREVACEEARTETRLSKYSEYNENGTKIGESDFIYQDGRLVKRITSDFEENDNVIGTYEYSSDKIKIIWDDNRSHWYEYLYENDKLVTINWYYDNFEWYWKVIEHDNQNRPVKLEEYYSDDNSVDYLNTYTYDGEYLTHYESLDQNTEYSDISYYYDYTYNRDYKCISLEDLTGSPSWFWIEESCINWTSETVTNKDGKYTNTQNMTYNNEGLPTRIDMYWYDGETKQHEQTYMIFEYDEVKVNTIQEASNKTVEQSIPSSTP